LKVLPDHDKNSKHLDLAAMLVSGAANDMVLAVEADYEGPDGPTKTAVICTPWLNPDTGEVALVPTAILVDQDQKIIEKITYRDGIVELDMHAPGCECGEKSTVKAFKVDPEVAKTMIAPAPEERHNAHRNGPGAMGYL
jgi:hypothetical protein